MPGLHTEVVGSGRPVFAFLHGLFGRGRNWTGVAQALAAEGLPSVLFDLPNHGSSAWTDEFSYEAMAAAVGDELELKLGSAASIIPVGHSMGGKVAMLLALARPRLAKALAVIDIAPAYSEGANGFGPLISALRTVDLESLSSRAEAETALEPLITDPAVRQFLMQNLRARPHWRWQPNLDLLEASLEGIAGWPDPGAVSYDGPVLWLTGERSDYVQPEHEPVMKRLFPQVRRETVAGAGHWVHADNPEAVISALQGLADSAQVGR